MNRRFKMNLSSRSITETINQLKQLSSDVEKARKEVVKALVVRTGELIQENYNTGKIDVTIRTIFRGEFFKHGKAQERIIISNNGYIKQKLPK